MKKIILCKQSKHHYAMELYLAYEHLTPSKNWTGNMSKEHREVQLMADGEEMGRFSIDGTLGTGETCSLGVSVEDSLQGKGYTRNMIQAMIHHVEHEQSVRPDQLLFIDLDMSAGYWDNIGMKTHRYGIDYRGKRQVEGRGYEKSITWQQLKRYAATFSTAFSQKAVPKTFILATY